MDGLHSTITLNNGVKMPRFGLGVWKTDNHTSRDSVATAIRNGYLGIDTARQYGNEQGTGAGIKLGLEQSGLKRSDLFVTTKLYNGEQGDYDQVSRAFENQLKDLGLDYVDLYLMHWPVDKTYLESYHAMERLYREGKIRAIGVSNFDNDRMKNLLDEAEIVPAVNQMEFNPTNQEHEILEFDRSHKIEMTAWSPLGGGASLTNPVIETLAKKYGRSTAQIILRWEWQRNIITVVKSTHGKRIIQNSQIFNFSLSAEDVQQINKLDQGKRALWYDDFQWHNPKGAFANSIAQWSDTKK
ncbi:aldo/keto reductase [Liquorilactobacillus mali]|uniref:Methylglyoxal reductase n=1 Tax=Liquorilactobacillus mali KCTC 3596 = DSM 20444 TaxID=1046596 RepID=J1F3N0_9LACO|nr:aldo/keto reductase [Liquorilactobacillus mali]EJE99984.1 methylglyoxal reductase [Liquorilactobacillus mali KCTC 3596 = DSM 20444]KRN08687.1 methylglyoxal reductase [Liquorilactobacillus mali KCTC 3596 = DSM 20444]MDC7954040.1 aldo/keto reductase [Liquorilactobacillus mali]QFQ75445.1 aldo/keto reductase [Liquorilactobacillus mali]